MELFLSGRYLSERLLGQGGFGSAFLARDRYTPTLRHCVVKLFQPSSSLGPKQLQMAQMLFEREAEVLEQLGNQHPQIPNLYAFFPLVVPSLRSDQCEEYFYLVQEFIDGEDFGKILHRRGPLSEKAVRAVLVSMLQVLAFVHQHGTIHRDIKPSNIMKGRNNELYLLDFGAVKQVTVGPGSGQSTGIYTTGYAPPEQMSGGQVFPSTDLYALAVTCVVLLTNQPTAELFDSYTHTWRWQEQHQVSPGLAAVLNRMLQATPNSRYQSADEALAALTREAGKMSVPNPSFPAQISPSPAAAAPSPLASPSPTAPPAPSATLLPTSRLSSLPAFLGAAAFTGVEGGLLAIAIFSLLGTTLLGSGTWLGLMIILIILQLRRIIERLDLLVIAGISGAAVLLLPRLQQVILPVSGGQPMQTVLMLAILAGLSTVAIAVLFRLIFRLVSRLI